MTQVLGFTVTKASAIVGLFVAFNYGLHILLGYIGGRLISYKAFIFIRNGVTNICVFILAFPSTEHLIYKLWHYF